MMNKDTKKPTEKVLLCRKSATPTVASFAKTKVNEIEKNGAREESGVEDSQDRKRNKEGNDWYGDGGLKKSYDLICEYAEPSYFTFFKKRLYHFRQHI